MNNVNILTIDHPNFHSTINLSLITNEEDIILVDTEITSSLSYIETELNKLNYQLSDISKLVLTHHDLRSCKRGC